jgi:hypothetical protein
MSIARVRNTVNAMKYDDDTDDGNRNVKYSKNNISGQPSSSDNNIDKSVVQVDEYRQARCVGYWEEERFTAIVETFRRG